jgi:NAD-dependent deacetylase
MRATGETDCLVAVGTTLQVYPVASLVPAAKSAGASLIIVNAHPTPFDHLADARLDAGISEVLPRMLG